MPLEGPDQLHLRAAAGCIELEMFRPWSHLTRQDTTAISQKMISSAFRDQRFFNNEN